MGIARGWRAAWAEPLRLPNRLQTRTLGRTLLSHVGATLLAVQRSYDFALFCLRVPCSLDRRTGTPKVHSSFASWFAALAPRFSNQATHSDTRGYNSLVSPYLRLLQLFIA
jgi:hypothetical protein